MKQYGNFNVHRDGRLKMNAIVGIPTLEGWTLYFTVQTDVSDPDDPILISKETGSGITHERNTADWVLETEDIAALTEDYFFYVWRLSYEDPDGYADLLDSGLIHVLPPVNPDVV